MFYYTQMNAGEREKLAKEAGEIARAETLKHCKAVKLTPRKVLKRLAEGLDAKETKCKYDGGQFGTRKWTYSRPLIAHGTRLDAVKIAASILNLIPEKGKNPDGDTDEATPVKVVIEVVDASRNKSESEPSPGAVPGDAS